MILGVIQARLGSTRLPGKVLMDVAGEPMLKRVWDRCQQMFGVDGWTVAFPSVDAKELVTFCLPRGIYFINVEGDPNDVLSRFWTVATATKATRIIRVTADCPLWDPAEGQRVLKAFKQGSLGYAHNLCPESDGTDTEVMTRWALEEAHLNTAGVTREHVTMGIRLNRSHVYCPVVGPAVHLSVDTQEDLEIINELWKRLPADFTWQQAVALSQEVTGVAGKG